MTSCILTSNSFVVYKRIKPDQTGHFGQNWSRWLGTGQTWLWESSFGQVLVRFWPGLVEMVRFWSFWAKWSVWSDRGVRASRLIEAPVAP